MKKLTQCMVRWSFLVAMTASSACDKRAESPEVPSGREEQSALLAQIEKDIGFDLPPHSVIKLFAEKPDFDPEWVAKIIIPTAELATFEARVRARSESGIQISREPWTRTPWWKPQGVSTNSIFVLDNVGPTYLRVVIGREGNKATAFLEYMVF